MTRDVPGYSFRMVLIVQTVPNCRGCRSLAMRAAAMPTSWSPEGSRSRAIDLQK